MGNPLTLPLSTLGGVHVGSHSEAELLLQSFREHLQASGLAECLKLERSASELRLPAAVAGWLAPGGDTLELGQRLGLDARRPQDLVTEIVLAMLLSPCPLRFTCAEQALSQLRMRVAIVDAARRTLLDFATEQAERPETHFDYDEERGFLLRPGHSLIEALELATQPAHSGHRYSFSCSRATEYVLLLAVARETLATNLELYQRISLQAERRALKGAAFDSAYVKTHGSVEAPLSVRYFIPGDRTWFRNPDATSSDVAGFEGSWTFYLGGGRFADFWREGHASSLLDKCLTLFLWSRALVKGKSGETEVDEAHVDDLLAATLESQVETERIRRIMERVQLPIDHFGGGCIDPSRDHLRSVSAADCEIELPDVER